MVSGATEMYLSFVASLSGSDISCFFQPTISPVSSADMAPISSGSSTWTSSGIHFSIVSMATGMGPSSSASQATMASVVTSTLLAGLGISGGVISSLPSSVGPTQVPQSTQNPTSSSVPVKTNTEPAAPSQDSKTNSGGKQSTQEGEEEENEEEGDGEQDEGEAEKKKKREKMVPDTEEKPANSTVANQPEISTPTSAPEDADRRPTMGGPTASGSPDEQLVRVEKNLTDVNAASTLEPRNDSAEIQIPQSSTVSSKINGKGSEGKSLWPFFVHTGEHHKHDDEVVSVLPFKLLLFRYLCDANERKFRPALPRVQLGITNSLIQDGNYSVSVSDKDKAPGLCVSGMYRPKGRNLLSATSCQEFCLKDSLWRCFLSPYIMYYC